MSKYTKEDVSKYIAITKIGVCFKLTLKGETTYSRALMEVKDPESLHLPEPENFEVIVEAFREEILKFASIMDPDATAELITPEEYAANSDAEEDDEGVESEEDDDYAD